MNFKNTKMLKAILLILFFSIVANVQSETNALGQQITVIGQKKDVNDNRTI